MDDDVPVLGASQNFVVNGPNAVMNELEYGLGFALFVENGKLVFGEAHTYSEELPQRFDRVDLVQLETTNRV